jgi:hypothetical protein
MADTLFLEDDDYAIWCFAAEDGKGTYEASATFERKADFAAGKPLIHGVRHVIKRRFTSQKEAMSAAAQMALLKVKRGEDLGL